VEREKEEGSRSRVEVERGEEGRGQAARAQVVVGSVHRLHCSGHSSVERAVQSTLGDILSTEVTTQEIDLGDLREADHLSTTALPPCLGYVKERGTWRL
jgi:hypothetical protein